jgi:predicted nucleic acid-binding protein
VRAFVDTNVIVYALTEQDSAKGAQARALLARHADAGSLVISTQVLGETFNVLTRKRGVRGQDALSSVRLLARHEVIAPTPLSCLAALELAVQHRLSTWDAMLVQAAMQARCDALYSEDMQPGRWFERTQIVNPFHPAAHEPLPPFGASAPVPEPAPAAKRSKRKRAG